MQHTTAAPGVSAQFFEAAVASGLADFIGRLNNPGNQIWRANLGETIQGSIAIDGEDTGDCTAHLRWFIVDDNLRGTGAGSNFSARPSNFAMSANLPQFICGPSKASTLPVLCMSEPALN